MSTDFDLFKQYAIQDSIITLWHAIQVEYSNYEFSQSFTIPITLSTLATNYLCKELVGEGKCGYHNPELNSLFSMKSIN